MTTQVFSAHHQIERYRDDLECYKRLHGNHELYVYLTIMEPLNPKFRYHEMHDNH